MKNKKIYTVIIISILSTFILSTVSFNTVNQAELQKNIINGDVYLNDKVGLLITPPWVIGTKLNLSPMRFCIECDCKNIECKLVFFDKKYIDEFLFSEGFGLYWFRNRLSFSINQKQYRGFENVIRGYSFSDKLPKFIIIEKETNGKL